MISWFALLAALLPLVSAFHHLQARTQPQTTCDTFDTISMWPYSLMTDLWGSSNGAGWQCATISSVNDNIVTWSTNYSWWDSTSIMSFTDIHLDEGLNQQLSAISSMPSRWSWTQSNKGVTADVAYDFFTSDTPGGTNAAEIMVWLAKFGEAGPISYEYDYSGKPLPIVNHLDINGRSWDLYYGSNGYNLVYSFIPTGKNIHTWSGDMYAFLSYLIENQYIDASQYLKTAEAGTEVTSGSGLFSTSAYSLSIN